MVLGVPPASFPAGPELAERAGTAEPQLGTIPQVAAPVAPLRLRSAPSATASVPSPPNPRSEIPNPQPLIPPFDSAQGLQPAALGCDQAKAAVAAIRPDIEANGPEALRTLLHQTDALLARSAHWSNCQKAARYRALLALHAASRSRGPELVEGAASRSPTTAAAVPPASTVPRGDQPVAPTDNPAAAPVRATGGSPSDALPISNRQSGIPHPQSSEASGPPKPQADAGLLPYDTKPSPDAIPFFDLVVPLGTQSKHGDLELRYLLRSALANLSLPPPGSAEHQPGSPQSEIPNPQSQMPQALRLIHLIGPKRPAWLHDHPMIRWHQWTPVKPKNHDIVAKFLHAANHPDVAEHVLGACDDFLFLKPFRPGVDYGAVRRHGVLAAATDQGYWKKAQAETRSLLEAAGYKAEFFDYHVPTLMTKTGWRLVDAEIPWRNLPGHAVWSLYHNVAGVHGPAVGRDGRSHAGWHAGDGSKAPASLDDVERAAFGRLFLHYNDGGLKGGILETWLAHRYPDPAPWEQDHLERGRKADPAPWEQDHLERGRKADPAPWEEGQSSVVSGQSSVARGQPASSPGTAEPQLGSPFSLPVRSPGPSLFPSPSAPVADPETGDQLVAPTPLRQAQGPRPAACGFPHDLDILVVLYGRSLPRAAAVAKTFARWHRHQQPMPHVLCAWCYRDGEAPGDLRTIPDYPWLQRIRLPQYDLDDGVFRKEGLLNYLLRDHATAPYILTLDADVWTPTKGWFRSIRDKLAEHPDHVLQPYRYFKDTAEDVAAWSWSAQTLPGLNPAKCKHPGLGWAFTRAWADKHGEQTVFNPWLVTGSGDCMFILEHFHDKRRNPYSHKHEQFRYFRGVERDGLPEGRLAAVSGRVWHENHTNYEAVSEKFRSAAFADRAYTWSRQALNCWGKLDQYLQLDGKGVLALRDPEGPFGRMLLRKPEMQDAEGTRRVIQECMGQLSPPTITIPRAVSWESICGWFSRADSMLNRRIAAVCRPDGIVVTLGVWHGRSVVNLAEELKAARKPNVTLVCIDLYPDDTLQVASRNLGEWPSMFLRGDTQETARFFGDGSVDAVFVDADHSFEGTARSIDLWTPKVRPGGMLCGHDYTPAWPGVMRAISQRFSTPVDTIGACWIAPCQLPERAR